MQHSTINGRWATSERLSGQGGLSGCASCGRLRPMSRPVRPSGPGAAETCQGCGALLADSPADRASALRAIIANHLI